MPLPDCLCNLSRPIPKKPYLEVILHERYNALMCGAQRREIKTRKRVWVERGALPILMGLGYTVVVVREEDDIPWRP